MAKGHKRQHTIPQSYLRAWCDPTTPKGRTPYVWIFPRASGIGQARAPVNIFHETDFYTIKLSDGSRNLALEKGLSQLEEDFTKLRRNILEKNSELTSRGRQILLAFNAAMHARTRAQRDHWRDQWTGAHDWSAGIKDAISEMSPEERGELIEGMSKLTQPPPNTPSISMLDFIKAAEEASESPMQHMLLPLISTIYRETWNLDIAIFETDATPGFITSDNPSVKSYVIDMEPAGSLRFRYILPLSPRQALVLNAGGFRGYIEAPPQFVKNTNSVVREMATKSFVVNRGILEPYPFLTA